MRSVLVEWRNILIYNRLASVKSSVLLPVIAFAILMAPIQAPAGIPAAGLNIGSATSVTFARQGRIILQSTLQRFHTAGTRLLVEKIPDPRGSGMGRMRLHPAFVWPQSIELLMLGAAAEYNPSGAPLLKSFSRTLHAYWCVHNGIGGFADTAWHKPLHRYYDDNEWITWGFLRAYRATHDRRYLRMAMRTFHFVLSGESSQLGGGLFWVEQNRITKNTCSNAPAIIDALKLYRATRNPAFIQTARRIYAWVNSRLLSRRDHLYYDHIDLHGRVGRTEWSYNTAAMIIANCQFYRLTHHSQYLRRAKMLGAAARNRWVDAATGGIKNPGPFAWVLIDAFIHLHDCDPAGHWRAVAVRAMQFVITHCHDKSGLYGAGWDRSPRAGTPLRLIDQASVGQSCFVLAQSMRK